MGLDIEDVSRFDYDKRQGLTTLLQEVTAEANCNIHFIKLHAPWSLLCTYAEELNLRAPLQVSGSSQGWAVGRSG